MFKHALKIEVSFDEETSRILDSQSRIVNWLHNHLLETANRLRADYRESQDKATGLTLYSKRGLRNMLPELKKEMPFLKAVHSSPLKNKALELSASIQAYQNTRKGKHKGKLTGWPRFRSWKRKWCSLFYDEPGKGFKVEGKDLFISLGQTEEGKRLRVKGRLEISPQELGGDKILNLRLKRDGHTFYAIFTCERELPKEKPVKKVIALDPNHKNLAYGVDNDGHAVEIENPWFLRDLERRIDVLKSRRDRCKRQSQLIKTSSGKSFWKPSRRWIKFHDMLNELYRLRRDRTKTYLYSIANSLFRDYDLVSIGDYTPRGGGISRKMRRSMNNLSVIGRFKEVLHWVSLRSGKHYSVWNEYNTTKTCSSCKKPLDQPLSPKIRRWRCPSCGQDHIRDENAAINGLQKTFEMRGSRLPEFVEIRSRRAWRYSGLGVREIPGAAVGNCL